MRCVQTFLHQWGALLVGLVVVGVVVSSMLTTKSELVKVRPAGMEMRVDIDANGESEIPSRFLPGSS
jgi:hypothetical protein